MLTVLDCFSGIGGFSIAAHAAGFETLQFVEIEPFCQRVLAKHWPGVPIHGDIVSFDAKPFRGRIGVVCGGFPCQDISNANPKGKGVDGPRSGLVYELLRIVQECEPAFVLLENSPRLRTKGIDRVLERLEEIGYAGEPFVVGGGNAGAPDERQRCIVVAHANSLRELQPQGSFANFGRWDHNGTSSGIHSNPTGIRRDEEQTPSVAFRGERTLRTGLGKDLPWRVHQPPVPGVDARLPHRVDRVKALGNAVKPQVVYPFFTFFAKVLGGLQ